MIFFVLSNSLFFKNNKSDKTLKNVIFRFCATGFLLALSSHAIATEKYSERCGICVPSNTIKPSKKGEIVKEC